MKSAPNLVDELSRQATLRPEAPALHLSGKTISYSELETLTWKVATDLHHQGARAGDVLALTFSDEFTLSVAMLATARIGATVFSIPKHYPAATQSEMASLAAATMLLTDSIETPIAGLPRRQIDIDSLAQGAAAIDLDVRDPSPQAPFLIVTGSGSTGNPKVFALSHGQLLARIGFAAEAISLSPDDRLITMAHLNFTSPKERYLAALSAGASVVLSEKKRDSLVDLCRESGVDVINATVFDMERLLATLPNDAKQVLQSVRVLQVSSSMVSDALRRRILEKISTNLYVRYATNESGLISVARPEGVLDPVGTVGRPWPGVEVEVIDGSGQICPPGETGHVRVKSPGVVDGYLNDAPATRTAFKDRWFMTGDLAKTTPDGQLVHCGRSDHMMIMNGINIYPAEIERTVLQHPAVRDAAVIPIHSALHQDLPVCAVTLDPAQPVAERELLAFTITRLGPRGPQAIVILDEIPRDERGKLLRAQARQEIAARLNAMNPSAHKSPDMASKNNEVVPQRQPAQRFTIKLSAVDAPALDVIAVWMKAALNIDPENDSANSFASEPRRVAVRQCTYALLLARSMLQAARVPVLDSGRVLGIEQDGKLPTDWVANVTLARINLLAPKCYAIALTESLHLVQWMAQRTITEENREILFTRIQRRVIQPVQALVAGGKSTLPVLRAAYKLNIPFTHLGAGVYQLGWGSNARRMDRSTTGSDSAIGSKLTRNKIWTANLLRTAGLPAAVHGLASTQEEAREVARKLGWPLVVKPVDGERGEGVTVGLADDQQLLKAFAHARDATKAKSAIVEREVSGVCHRLFIANQRLLYSVKRWPKSIHGDGRQSIRELVHDANRCEERKPPWLRSEVFPLDAMAVETIRLAGYSIDDIPPMGKRIPLRNIESTQWGGFDEDVTNRVHPDNLDIALRAATLFGLAVAGIDIISPDISMAWHQNGAIINEVNFAPLLGGGEISRQYIPAFLQDLLKGNGRIPLEVVLGNETAIEVAKTRQKELASCGLRTFVTSHDFTLQPSGVGMTVPFVGLYARCRALLLNVEVDALILVAQTDEFLHTGMPVDRIDLLTAVGGELSDWKLTGTKLAPNSYQALASMLKQHC